MNKDDTVWSRALWEERVLTHKGVLIDDIGSGAKSDVYTTVLDGKDYDYVSLWDDDEDAEKFVDTFADDIIKSGADYIGGIFTFFFSVKS